MGYEHHPLHGRTRQRFNRRQLHKSLQLWPFRFCARHRARWRHQCIIEKLSAILLFSFIDLVSTALRESVLGLQRLRQVRANERVFPKSTPPLSPRSALWQKSRHVYRLERGTHDRQVFLVRLRRRKLRRLLPGALKETRIKVDICASKGRPPSSSSKWIRKHRLELDGWLQLVVDMFLFTVHFWDSCNITVTYTEAGLWIDELAVIVDDVSEHAEGLADDNLSPHEHVTVAWSQLFSDD